MNKGVKEMKKKISLVLALVIMVIPTFGFQMMQASAAAPKYEEYETFENASNLFDDTAFWSTLSFRKSNRTIL